MMIRLPFSRRVLRAGLLPWLLLLSGLAWAQTLEPVRLQLKWRHQFQFAGYYAALEKGYYRDAGFDVTLMPARPGVDAVSEVVAGRADFGVASAELVQRYAQGEPVVALAVIFQHSPLVLFARRASGIATLSDLPGKRVAMADYETELFAYLKREQVPLKALVRERHAFTADALLNGTVDAMAGYDTDEAWFLRDHPDDYIRFTPRGPASISTATPCSPAAPALPPAPNRSRPLPRPACAAGVTPLTTRMKWRN